MHEIEIETIPPLTPTEQSVLDLHSVVNIANVVHSELAVLGLLVANDETHFRGGIAACAGLRAALADPAGASAVGDSIDAFAGVVSDEIAAVVAVAGAAAGEVEELRANLRMVLSVLEVRVRELLARLAAPGRWERFD